MNNRYEAIIIGAGPAGLTAATDLAVAGLRVLVIEKNRNIGSKACAGGITWSGLLKEVPERIIAAAFAAQYIHTPLQEVTIKETHPIVATVSRHDLGAWMATRAEKAGAEIITGLRVERIEGKSVIVDGETLHFDHLIGADGSASLVRRHLGFATAADYGIGISYRVPGEFKRMEWHLDTRRFGNGYAWIFPHGRLASIGAYCHYRAMTAAALKHSLLQWGADNDIDLKQKTPRAARINLDYRGWRFGRIFLVGDAAGLASPLTGEGILPAVISGRAAARAIVNPEDKDPEMTHLLQKWRRHRNLLRVSAPRMINRLIFESLVFAMKHGFINFRTLEMK